MNLGDIPDLDSLELYGRIEETDRGRISATQDVVVRVDALPELSFKANVSQISPLAETSLNEFPPTRSFRALASITNPDRACAPA
jgi:multidrug resistance efflux pump